MTMKWKYYLRGLGVGIVVTTLVLGVLLADKRTMTDEEVIARAKALGMTEDKVLSHSEDVDGEQNIKDVRNTESEEAEEETEPLGPNVTKVEMTETDTEVLATGNEDTDIVQPEEIKKDNLSAENKEENAENSSQEEEQVKENEDTPSKIDENPDASKKNEAKPKADEETDANGRVTLVIASGDGSYTVAQKLERLGLISSASEYDTYLCDNGYDKRLRAGTFSIPANAGDERIARIITGNE